MRARTAIGVAAATGAAGLGGFWLFAERGRLVQPSTVALARAAGPGSPLDGLHGYVYGRWTAEYIAYLRRWVLPRAAPEDRPRLADHYHSKVLRTEDAKAIVTLERPIPLVDLEQIIPYNTARHLVLEAGPDVALYECACRGSKADHCEPTQVCMVVGQPFVDFILEHHPQTARRATREQALAVLDEEHERGHVHTAWFKDVMLDRFYAICNCCTCCCVGLEAMKKWDVPTVVSSGYVAAVDGEACTGCERCVDACPFDAITIEQDVAVVDWAACMGCGVCEGQCRFDAIALRRDEAKGIPLDVRALAAQVVA